MKNQSAKLVFALLTTSACFSTPAAMYRWVDENGVTVYSQSPPPSGDAVELQGQPAPSAETTDAARERLRDQLTQDFDDEEARSEAEAEKAKQAADEALREENCAAARENLEKFQNLGPRRVLMPDGKTLRLSEDEVQAQITKAQGQVKTFCEK
jgi:hypothetical protein